MNGIKFLTISIISSIFMISAIDVSIKNEYPEKLYILLGYKDDQKQKTEKIPSSGWLSSKEGRYFSIPDTLPSKDIALSLRGGEKGDKKIGLYEFKLNKPFKIVIKNNAKVLFDNKEQKPL